MSNPNLIETTGGSTKRTTLGKTLIQFSPEIKSLVRKLEKTLIKCKRKTASVVFNKTCLKENMLPKYAKYIYIYTHTHTHIAFIRLE